MKNFSIKNMNRPVILLFMLFLSGNIIILPLLIAGTGMDRKVILAMEQVKEEMKAKASDDFPADSDGDELTGTPLPDPAVIPPEEDVVPAGEAVREDFKLDSGAEKPVPASTPEPEKISLKEKLDQRGSLKFVDEDIRIVLRSLAKAYDFNVTLAPEVQGKVTVDFNNVKIINALNTILVDQGLGYRISGSILRVTSLEKIQEEDATDASREAAAAQKAVEAAKKRAAKEAAEPLVVQIFKLKYIDANDAKEAITPMISGRGKAMILQTKQYTGFEFEATESFGVAEEEKAATKFVRSRTLIVQDIQTVLDRVDQVIIKIDQRPPQIMIDAKVLEVPVDQEFRLGINWTQALNQWQVGASDLQATFDRRFGREKSSKNESSRRWGEDNSDLNENFNKRDINDGSSSGNLSYAGSSYPGSDDSNTISIPDLVDWDMIDRPGGPYQENASWQAIVSNDLAQRGYNNTESKNIFDNYLNVISDSLTNLTTSGQVYSAVLGAADFNLMLSAMRTDSNIVILSNPRIIVHENYAAKIFVGKRHPIVEFESSESGSGNTSGGLTVKEWKEIGITLKVIPQVRETLTGGKGINMIIHPAVSSSNPLDVVKIQDPFTGYETEYPIIKIREADTNVTINNGDTIVIGGLISSYTVDEEDKIPLLGDIPILGYLFKEEHTQLKKTNLLIFITARIVTEDTELSSYEKIMLEKSPPDALEDIRYIENEDLRPNLYKSKEDLEALKSEMEAGEEGGDENEGEDSEQEDEEKENNQGNFEGRKMTKAMRRSRLR